MCPRNAGAVPCRPVCRPFGGGGAAAALVWKSVGFHITDDDAAERAADEAGVGGMAARSDASMLHRNLLASVPPRCCGAKTLRRHQHRPRPASWSTAHQTCPARRQWRWDPRRPPRTVCPVHGAVALASGCRTASPCFERETDRACSVRSAFLPSLLLLVRLLAGGGVIVPDMIGGGAGRG